MRWTDDEGTAHELPKLTRRLAKRLSGAAEEPAGDKRWRAQLDVVAECLGDDTEAVVGGTKLDDVDVSQLEAAFVGIRSAYGESRRRAEMRQVEEQLAALDVDRLTALADVLDKLDGSRQGFKSVR